MHNLSRIAEKNFQQNGRIDQQVKPQVFILRIEPVRLPEQEIREKEALYYPQKDDKGKDIEPLRDQLLVFHRLNINRQTFRPIKPALIGIKKAVNQSTAFLIRVFLFYL